MANVTFDQPEPRLGGKIRMLPWIFILMVLALGLIGGGALYSAANGSFLPWAKPHLIRFGMSVVIMLVFALVDIRVWFRLAYPTYAVMLALLAGVEVAGKVGAFGAQRWINLGFVQIQPSELMKIALVMALARYFHGQMTENVQRFRTLAIPVAMILAPTAFVLLQPNLGTAIMLMMVGAALLYVGGIRTWLYGVVAAVAAAAAPILWRSMHGYQKRRVMTFLDPSVDPLGAGYHITQSRIALGSGGLFGKGFLNGTQSHLNFLPEKQTDFIFPLLAEEWGLWGGVALLGLFVRYDNDEVKVARALEKANVQGKFHQHEMNRVMIYLQPGKQRFEYQDGRPTVLSVFKAGEVVWSPPTGMHAGTVLDHDFNIIEVEMKTKSTSTPISSDHDPLKVDPAQCKLELENSQVRVVRDSSACRLECGDLRSCAARRGWETARGASR